MTEEYYCVPVLDVDQRVHTDNRPFCYEQDCPCHNDTENFNTLFEWHDAGLITYEEAKLIYNGQTV